MQKMTKRKLQAIETKSRIYEVALRLMEQEGFENIRIEQICKEAGVSIGTFYHYFKSKNDILDEIFKIGDEYFKNEVADSLKGEAIRDEILDYFDKFAKFYIWNGIEIIKSIYKTQSKLFVDEDRLIVTLLRDIIKKGVERKEIVAPDMSPEEITDFLFVAARGLVFKWCVTDGAFQIDEEMHRFVDRLLRALIREPSTLSASRS